MKLRQWWLNLKQRYCQHTQTRSTSHSPFCQCLRCGKILVVQRGR